MSEWVVECTIYSFTGVSNLLASLSHTGRRVFLGHTLNTLQHIITKKKKTPHVLSKFRILCWATFIAILGCMRPAGCRLDTPDYSLSGENHSSLVH